MYSVFNCSTVLHYPLVLVPRYGSPAVLVLYDHDYDRYNRDYDYANSSVLLSDHDYDHGDHQWLTTVTRGCQKHYISRIHCRPAVELVQSYRKIGVWSRATLYITSCMHSSPAIQNSAGIAMTITCDGQNAYLITYTIVGLHCMQ